MLSVLILTLDEEFTVADCISSLPWREDVHVLDSESRDRTVTIARDMGAKVSARPFDGFASQRNAGLSLPFENDWIVMLDADERMTPALAAEIEAKVAAATPEVSMFLVRRRDMFRGRWLKRSSGYPTWFARVFRRGRVTVRREINEQYYAQGETPQLNGHIDHYPLSKGVDWWYQRHQRYSTAEAKLLVERSEGVAFARVFSGDPTIRRGALKALAYRLPMRPYLAFLYLYVVRGGVFDGYAGWLYANMRLAYEIMIDTKIAELRLECRRR